MSFDRIGFLVDAYETEQGRAATPEERDGIAAAHDEAAAGSTLARVALGPLIAVNDDWPEAYRETARRQYGLATRP